MNSYLTIQIYSNVLIKLTTIMNKLSTSTNLSDLKIELLTHHIRKIFLFYQGVL